jgi:hypothetical protein
MTRSDETKRARVDAALQRASDELGLATYYRDCVRPLLAQPREQWPTCCGGGCEPCNQILVMVADRVAAILSLDGQSPPDDG